MASTIPVNVVAYEALIGAAGTAALADVILQIADDGVGVDEVFAFWIAGVAAPVRIASSGRVGSSLARASMYSTRFHAMDPLSEMIHSAKDGAPTQSRKILAAEINDPIYRRECFDRPGLFEKLSFVRTHGDRHFVLSFYRHRERYAAAIGALSMVAEMAFPVLRKHVDIVGTDFDLPVAMRIERKLAEAFPLLTRREREVCARSIIGMTAEAIGIDLDIGITSVLTYRRRAYERYNLSGTGHMVVKLLG